MRLLAGSFFAPAVPQVYAGMISLRPPVGTGTARGPAVASSSTTGRSPRSQIRLSGATPIEIVMSLTLVMSKGRSMGRAGPVDGRTMIRYRPAAG